MQKRKPPARPMYDPYFEVGECYIFYFKDDHMRGVWVAEAETGEGMRFRFTEQDAIAFIRKEQYSIVQQRTIRLPRGSRPQYHYPIKAEPGRQTPGGKE